jgi:hypothetical protein
MLSIASDFSALTSSDIQMQNGFVFGNREDVPEAIHQPQSELRGQRRNPVAKESTPVLAFLRDQVVIDVHPRTNITKWLDWFRTNRKCSVSITCWLSRFPYTAAAPRKVFRKDD